MKIAKYNLFVARVRRNDQIKSSIETIDFFRFHEGYWRDETEVDVSDPDLKEHILRTHDAQEAWRERNSPVTYFPVPELAAVAVANFVAAPKKRTRDWFADKLSECLQQTDTEFRANYDALTGIAKRELFDDALENELTKLRAESPTIPSTLENIESRKGVAVISIDIDHFKQVNDQFGHIHGDLVLRCLASRLEATCEIQTARLSGKVTIFPARPGGEEFAVLVAGASTPAEEWDIAEALRQSIDGDFIPNDKEWIALKRELNLPLDVVPPPMPDRRLTISVGIASVRAPLVTNDSPSTGATRLKNQSDLALYRAKSSGRNQIVAFRDILLRYGMVLEQHPDTKIVAIDLGRKVNVRIGQEFKVFHPLFTGKEPFIFSDGRTQRRLGLYPRVPCGQIEVFDVQEEISFCRAKNTLSEMFSARSTLEAIPLGSIEHLLAEDGTLGPRLGGRKDVETRLLVLLRDELDPRVYVVSVQNADQLSEERGTTYVNKLLANVYELLKELLPDHVYIGQISPLQFAAVGVPNDDFDDKSINGLLGQIRGRFGDGAKVVVGTIDGNDARGFLEATGQELDMAGALDLAQYAVISRSEEMPSVVRFGRWVVERVLYLSRSSSSVGQAERDYEIFRKWNALEVDGENQMALLYWVTGSIEKALQTVQRALDLEPEASIIWLNAAVIKYYAGDVAGGFAAYSRAYDNDPEIELGPAYLEPIAMLNVAAHERGDINVDLLKTLTLLYRAAESLPEDSDDRAVVAGAITMLEQKIGD